MVYETLSVFAKYQQADIYSVIEKDANHSAPDKFDSH